MSRHVTTTTRPAVLWDPIPRDLSADLACYAWTASNPAPEIVAYAWTWRQARDGATPSIRDLAVYSGRGKTWAQRVRQRVLDDMGSWGSGGGLAVPNGTPAGQSRDTDGTGDEQPVAVVEAERDTRGTVAGHPRDTSRARVSFGQDRDKDKDPEDPNLSDSPTLVDREDPADPQAAPPAPEPDTAPAKGSPKLTAWADDLWTEIQAVRVELAPGCRPQKLTKERRQNLVARGRQIAAAGLGRADLIRAVRWVLTPSDNPHVRGAQATGDPVGVLLRPKHVVAYCELAEAEARTGPQAVAATSDPAATAWDRLLSDMPALGAACIRGAPPRVLAAVDAVGGINRLCRLDGFDLSRQRPTFLSAFHRHVPEQRHAEPFPAESPDRPAALHRPG